MVTSDNIRQHYVCYRILPVIEERFKVIVGGKYKQIAIYNFTYVFFVCLAILKWAVRLRCRSWRPACRGRISLLHYALFRNPGILAIGVHLTGPVLGADGLFVLVVVMDGHVPDPFACGERRASNRLLIVIALFLDIQETLAPTYTKHNEHM